jgi:site-specific DNA recombinase
MRSERGKTTLRCAVYTRVSTEHGLEQEFNSLDNQREASEAYVKSQAREGWKLIRTHYNDGGYSGGSMERSALKRLLDDVRAHRIERLTLNVLLSFAQFEREVTGERIRDEIAASKRKGIWMGGVVPLGYRVENRALHVVEQACRLHPRSLSALSRDRQRRAAQGHSGPGGRPVAIPERRYGQALRRRVDRPRASLQDPVEPHLPWAVNPQGPGPRWSSRSHR